jgi:molecular chaperone GrpE
MTSSKKKIRIPVRRSGEVDPGPASQETEAPVVEPCPDVSEAQAEKTVDWSDAALRLRAEMDNFRKRQQRLAEERILAEKMRLLTGFVGIVDNLERVIAHLNTGDPNHQSIRVTYDEMLKLLRLEGVEPIEAVGALFDPLQHEAVAMVPAQDGQEMRIIDEEQKGYRLGDQILRPARVIVAG